MLDRTQALLDGLAFQGVFDKLGQLRQALVVAKFAEFGRRDGLEQVVVLVRASLTVLAQPVHSVLETVVVPYERDSCRGLVVGLSGRSRIGRGCTAL